MSIHTVYMKMVKMWARNDPIWKLPFCEA